MGRALASIPLPELSRDYYARLGERLVELQPVARPARERSRLLRLAIATAAVAAAVALAVFTVLPALRSPETATAAEMLASMEVASADPRVVRLTITEQRAPLAAASPSSGSGAAGKSRPLAVSEQLTLSSSGDVRYTAVREHLDGMGTRVVTETLETYDAGRHTMMRRGETHVAEGETPPDPDPYAAPRPATVIVERPSWGTTVFSTFLLANFQALSNSLRAALAESDPGTPVRLTTYLGRPAWQAALRETLPSAGGGGIAVEWDVTVDRGTGLLVASELKPASGHDLPAGLARSFRVTRLEVDPDLPAAWQRIETSGVDEVAIFDPGTRFGTVETVAARAWPTLVLIPADVPAGYRLADVATRDYEGMEKAPGDLSTRVELRRSDPRTSATVREHVDASTQRVMVRYRRGLSTFVIAIRPLGSGGSTGKSSGRPGAETVELGAGFLKGAQALLWVSPYFGDGPTLSVRSDRSRITITGDLTRQELLDAANSLTAHGDAGRPLPEGYGE